VHNEASPVAATVHAILADDQGLEAPHTRQRLRHLPAELVEMPQDALVVDEEERVEDNAEVVHVLDLLRAPLDGVWHDIAALVQIVAAEIENALKPVVRAREQNVFGKGLASQVQAAAHGEALSSKTSRRPGGKQTG